MVGRGRQRARAVGAAMAVVAALGAASCQEPTQMRLVLRTDLPCGTPTTGAPFAVNDVSIYVAADDATLRARMQAGTPSAYLSGCARGVGGELGTLYLTPSGSDLGMVAVMAGLVHATPAGMARQSAETCTSASQENCLLSTRRFRYSAHQTGVVPVLLEASCVNHRPECAPGQTCRGGLCTSDVVDPVEGAKDAGVLPDAGNLDAALDVGGPFANILECAKGTVVWTPPICSAGAQKQCLAEAASRLFAACGATCTLDACCAPAGNPDQRCCVEGKVPVLRPINPGDFNPQCPGGGLRACFSLAECEACGGKFETSGMVGFGACSRP